MPKKRRNTSFDSVYIALCLLGCYSEHRKSTGVIQMYKQILIKVEKMKRVVLCLLSIILFLFAAACNNGDERIATESQEFISSAQSNQTDSESNSESPSTSNFTSPPGEETSPREETGFMPLPQDASALGPANLLEKALRLTQPEVEETLGLTFSEDSVNPRTGGYLLDCQVAFGDMTATQVDLGFGKVNQEDEDALLLSVAYQFSFDTAQEGWEAFQASVEEARDQGAISTMEEYYGQESGFIRYGTFEEFDAGARESMGESGLPTVECLDRFYVDDRTICEYSFVYAPDQGYIASVSYSAEIVRTMDQGNRMK